MLVRDIGSFLILLLSSFSIKVMLISVNELRSSPSRKDCMEFMCIFLKCLVKLFGPEVFLFWKDLNCKLDFFNSYSII